MRRLTCLTHSLLSNNSEEQPTSKEGAFTSIVYWAAYYRMRIYLPLPKVNITSMIWSLSSMQKSAPNHTLKVKCQQLVVAPFSGSLYWRLATVRSYHWLAVVYDPFAANSGDRDIRSLSFFILSNVDTSLDSCLICPSRALFLLWQSQ